ncbi:hypothetical protein IAT38_008239 [Cryptococcus sp. DSM 104549]
MTNDTAGGYNPLAGGMAPPSEHQHQQTVNGYYDGSVPFHANLHLPMHSSTSASTNAPMSGTYGSHQGQAPGLTAPPHGPGYIYTFPALPATFTPIRVSRGIEGSAAQDTTTGSDGTSAKAKKPRATRTKKVPAAETSGKTKPASTKAKGMKAAATGTGSYSKTKSKQKSKQKSKTRNKRVFQACLPCQVDGKVSCAATWPYECQHCRDNNMMCDWGSRRIHFRCDRYYKGMPEEERKAEKAKTQKRSDEKKAEEKVIRGLINALEEQYPGGAPRPMIRVARPGSAWFATEEEVREYREALARLPPPPPPPPSDDTTADGAGASTSPSTSTPASSGSGSASTVAGPSNNTQDTPPSSVAASEIGAAASSPAIDPGLGGEDVQQAQPPIVLLIGQPVPQIEDHGAHHQVYQQLQQGHVGQYDAYQYDPQQHLQGYYQQQHQVSGDQYSPQQGYYHVQQQDNIALPYTGMWFPHGSNTSSSFVPAPGAASETPAVFLEYYQTISLVEADSQRAHELQQAQGAAVSQRRQGSGGGWGSDEEWEMVVTPEAGAVHGAGAGVGSGSGAGMAQSAAGPSNTAGPSSARASANEQQADNTLPTGFAYPNGLSMDLDFGNDTGSRDYEGWEWVSVAKED